MAAARLLGIERTKIYRRLDLLSKLPPANPA
jgi:transcriptional regulator of acetoin/glycerol metabolism